MFSSNLPGPVLLLALDPVARIQQSDGIAVGGLWSVITKVRDAVIDGQRLENLTWRLWYRARAKPGYLPTKSLSSAPAVSSGVSSCPPFLSSPSLSLSSSSDDTSTSSDWDRETAVGEADDYDFQPKHSKDTPKNSVISPPVVNPRLNLGVELNLQHPRPISSSAPSWDNQGRSVQDQSVQGLPPALPSHSLPHHTPQATIGHVGGAHFQSAFVPDSQHHPHHPGPALPGVALLSPAFHKPMFPLTSAEDDNPNVSSDITADANILIPLTGSSVPSPSVATFLSSTKCASFVSMPTALLTTQENNSSVGRLIARLFAESTMSVRETRSGQEDTLPGKQQLGPAFVGGNPILVTPNILEPSSLSVVPGSPVTTTSAFTSATSTPRQSFPTVIVVNPTPHPTPPATPSPEESDTQFDVNTNTVPINRPNRPPESGWGGRSGSANGQLSTPVSINGDARSVDDSSVMELDRRREQQSHLSPFSQSNNVYSTTPNPTGMIVLPERQSEHNITSPHLPTPAAEILSPSEKALCAATNSTTVPIPAPAPAPTEDKIFFLAAPHSGSGGSGHESTESPDSLGPGSISPLKHGAVNGHTLLNPRDRRDDLRKDEDVSSSYSASSPRAPSITSSKGGPSRRKGRAVFDGGKRKTAKRVALLAKDSRASRRKDMEILSTATEGSRGEVVEKAKGSSSSKGKEREVRGRQENELAVSGTSTMNTMPRTKSLHQLPVHRSALYPQHPALHLRQLPTNPPRRQPSPGRRSNDEPTESQLRAKHSQVKSEACQASHHSQLDPLALGHLPSIPPRPRRPIEITETSTDYSTTDTDGDDSSWESESISEGGVQSASQPGPSRTHRKGLDSLKSEKRAGLTSGSNNRTRDPGEFVRDAALEARRQKDMFQKLPERSYSNLGQLSRTKSGLSQLFRPDPELFPEGHPYRMSRSSQDLAARNWSSPVPPLAMTAVTKRGSVVEPVQAAVNVSSVKSKTDRSDMVNGRRSSAPQRSGYRPRVKPADQVEESDSEDEDPDDVIQVSSSIAERRLAALVGARGTKSILHPRKPSPAQVENQCPNAPDAPPLQSITRTATMPVTMHPFLPEPAPLQTPHTIRRNIISQELDEELRRNLLWERSQNQVQGRPPRAPGSILPGPWRGLTPLRPNENADSQVANTSDRPDNRSFATQRTKSWAGDYHASGW